MKNLPQGQKDGLVDDNKRGFVKKENRKTGALKDASEKLKESRTNYKG